LPNLGIAIPTQGKAIPKPTNALPSFGIVIPTLVKAMTRCGARLASWKRQSPSRPGPLTVAC
jgi:hypothetical protein